MVTQNARSRVSIAAALAFAVLGGCQAPGTRSVTDGARTTTHALRQEPHRAAVCIARNIDRHAGGYIARIRQGTAPALIEVDVRSDRVLALAQLAIRDDGSLAHIRIEDAPPIDANELASVMIAGC